MGLRGFRYLSTESLEIAKEIKKNGFVQVDIESESEVEQVCEDMEEYGILLDDTLPFKHDVLEFEDDPEFYARVYFNDEYYIDFFLQNEEQEEKDSEGLFWR